MGRRHLSVGTAVYVWTILTAGVVSSGLLLSSTDWSAWKVVPIVFFCVLSILATALSITYQGFLPTRTVHQIGTSFAYALFLLVDPSAVCLVLCTMAGADWIFNRRKPLPAVFNMAQLSVSLGAAVLVRRAIDPHLLSLAAIGVRTMVAAFSSLLVFFLVNHLLTHGIVSLSSRRSFFRLDSGMRDGALNEILCIVSGIGMAVFWSIQPWLVLLGVIPIWILIFVFILLSIKEQELENRQTELKSLQGLGLEIGAELDVERLRLAVVRIATEALQASGALLAVRDGSSDRLRFVAHHGAEAWVPESAALDPGTRELFEAGSIQSVEDFRSQSLYPTLSFLPASGILLAPLQILGRREGLLILFHGDSRRPFNEDDSLRMENLVRFVDVALSNAQLVSDLKQMQEQLVQTEKMSALGMLVSGVAHEINNPLTSVVGYTQLVLGDETDPKKRRMLTRVFSEAERAGKIVQNLLTFSRKHKVEKKLTDINDVLEQVLELRAYDLRVNNVEIERAFSPALPKVLVDPHQFQQVFLNLITNAEHAIRETGKNGRIRIETAVAGETVRVVLADNGPGIGADNLRKVFLPFFTTKEVGRGTGLGLSICYGIVQEHGGRIEVTSKLGEGATFIVEIPATREAVDAAALEGEQESVEAVASAIGRLLVVDDEEAIASLVRDTLEPEGWQVQTARDGAEALERLDGEEFDVLLVDMRMPGMDGRTFFERLRVVKPEMAKRVVFATGDAASDSTARFLDDAGTPVLGKPYNLLALIEAVSRIAATGGVEAKDAAAPSRGQ
jgi:signal transduction histidine kinase/ActR/RegA family two-component response regulator